LRIIPSQSPKWGKSAIEHSKYAQAHLLSKIQALYLANLLSKVLPGYAQHPGVGLPNKKQEFNH
jgi:hypothetical protein